MKIKVDDRVKYDKKYLEMAQRHFGFNNKKFKNLLDMRFIIKKINGNVATVSRVKDDCIILLPYFNKALVKE